jgi:hypothetical protein
MMALRAIKAHFIWTEEDIMTITKQALFPKSILYKNTHPVYKQSPLVISETSFSAHHLGINRNIALIARLLITTATQHCLHFR